MKAVCWMGKKDIRVETVPDPKIINPHDVIIKITSVRNQHFLSIVPCN